MGIDNHLQFSEDEAGTRAMFARENRARERYNKCRAMDCKITPSAYSCEALDFESNIRESWLELFSIKNL